MSTLFQKLQRNYVEAHHLIPMGFQDDFSKSIDVEANIISLCTYCHKNYIMLNIKVIEPLIKSYMMLELID